MAAASLVATALGIILLLVTGYVLVGGALTSSQVVMEAQKDMTAAQVEMLGTGMEITAVSPSSNPIYIQVTNSGNVPIIDFDHTDVFLLSSGNVPVRIRYNSAGGDNTWQKVLIYPDLIHPNQWDPGEDLNMSVTYSGSTPRAVQITTANGVSAYYTVPS
jgi:flagellar protein FlaF